MGKLKDIYLDFRKETAAIAIGDLAPIAIAFVVVIIVLTVGALVITEMHADQVQNSSAFNVTREGILGLNNLSGQLPLLATVVIFAVIIGVVVGFFAMSAGRSGGQSGGREV